MTNYLVSNLPVSLERPVGDFYLETSSKGSILHLVLNQFSRVNENLSQVLVQLRVGQFELLQTLSGFVLQISWLAIVSLYYLALCVVHSSFSRIPPYLIII